LSLCFGAGMGPPPKGEHYTEIEHEYASMAGSRSVPMETPPHRYFRCYIKALDRIPQGLPFRR
jgi:hypothetical protein